MYSQNIISNNFKLQNRNRFLFFFLLFLLSSIGMFGQTNVVTSEVKKTSEIIVENKIASVDSQIDFVSWFMGTKQSQMIDSNSTKNTSNTVTKKQILFLGITPNKVLYRTLMKKVSSQDNAIV